MSLFLPLDVVEVRNVQIQDTLFLIKSSEWHQFGKTNKSTVDTYKATTVITMKNYFQIPKLMGNSECKKVISTVSENKPQNTTRIINNIRNTLKTRCHFSQHQGWKKYSDPLLKYKYLRILHCKMYFIMSKG